MTLVSYTFVIYFANKQKKMLAELVPLLYTEYCRLAYLFSNSKKSVVTALIPSGLFPFWECTVLWASQCCSAVALRGSHAQVFA